MKILAIDDNADNLTSLQAVVSDELPGATVLTALNGVAGIEIAKAEDPDVILLDVIMPGMDGYATCEALKNDPLTEAIPVLFVTALKATRESRMRALRIGAEGFLTKPIDEIDLIAQIRAMAKIKASNRFVHLNKEQLALMVAERTSQLEHELQERLLAEEGRDALQAQLLQSQKLEAIGRLAGGVAHDFNNMLGVILGLSEIAMLKVGSGDPLYADLMEIHEAGERSAALTKQLLAFSRQQTVDPIVIDLNIAVESSLAMIGRLIGEDVVLDWRPADKPMLALIDPFQVDQVLANLCINARDAIDGQGRISIRLTAIELDASHALSHPIARPGNFVVATVQDDGRGMDAETRENIFEPFFTTKPEGTGTGLGMSTVFGIVSQNNGFIEVSSAPDMGTSMRVYFPQHEGPLSNVAEVVSSHVGNGETILMVEDELQVFSTVKTMLERHGYTVLGANRPQDAIELLSSGAGPVDLLLTDVIMPDIDGRELMERLRRYQPGLPCLFMSGYPADIIAQRGVLNEGVHFVSKPFSMDQLSAAVSHAISLGETQARTATVERTILAVEDEPSLLYFLRFSLEALGYNVLSAASFDEATRIADDNQGRIDLLLTDLHMPGGNGVDLSAQLRKGNEALRCLFVSGDSAKKVNQDHAMEPDAHFLQKPFTMEELGACVEAVLDER